MFDVCGLWILKCILGEILLPDQSCMDKNWRQWVARNESLKSPFEAVDFQTDFVMDLVADCGEDYKYDIETKDIFYSWLNHKNEDLMSYRDKSFTSKYTGTPSPIHWRHFMEAHDDSLETFMNGLNNNIHEQNQAVKL